VELILIINLINLRSSCPIVSALLVGGVGEFISWGGRDIPLACCIIVTQLLSRMQCGFLSTCMCVV
jgi:hypothetical protein